MIKTLSSFLVEPIKSFTDNKELIVYLVKSELKSRHFRKVLGPLWWLFEPLSMSIIYFFLTTILFKSSSNSNQLLFILVAVIAWRWFSKSIDESPIILTSYGNILSRTNLPLLPFLYVAAGTQMIFFLAGLIVVFFLLALFGIHPTIYLLYLPLLILIQGTFNLGLSSLLARAGVYFKDLSSIVWVLTGIWFYLSPGIYSESLIPQEWRFFYDLNPWATLMPAYRDILINGAAPELTKLSIWFMVFLIMAIVGLRVISRNRGKLYKEL